MYKYTKIRVNTIEEYITAVEDGYFQIGHPNLTTEEIIEELEQYQDEDNDLAVQYATLLIEQGDPSAIDILERLAKDNNPRALLELGHIYLEGKLVDSSIKKAFTYFIKAGDLGLIEAQYIGNYLLLSNDKEIVDDKGDLKIDLNSLLEYIAFKMAIDDDITLETAISGFLNRENNSEEVKSLSSYLRDRRIITNDNFSHDIYLSFYAARYMYHQIYETDDYDDKKYIAFKEEGTEVLDEYNEMFFNEEDNLWPSITLCFLGNLDHAIHEVEKERTFFDDMSPSYGVFDCSLKEIIDNMSDIAYQVLEYLVSKGNFFYWSDFIKDYIDRD